MVVQRGVVLDDNNQTVKNAAYIGMNGWIFPRTHNADVPRGRRFLGGILITLFVFAAHTHPQPPLEGATHQNRKPFRLFGCFPVVSGYPPVLFSNRSTPLLVHSHRVEDIHAAVPA